MTLDRLGISKITNVVMAVLGLLLTHEIAYLLASWIHSDHHALAPDHHHQNWLLSLAGPMALLAAAAVIVHHARRLGLSVTTSAPRLAGGIVALYLVQETVEVLAGGHELRSIAANRAVLVGLVVAPIVATLLVAIMAQASELVRAWFSTTAPVPGCATPRLRPTGQSDTGAVWGEHRQARAPPFVCM